MNFWLNRSFVLIIAHYRVSKVTRKHPNLDLSVTKAIGTHIGYQGGRTDPPRYLMTPLT